MPDKPINTPPILTADALGDILDEEAGAEPAATSENPSQPQPLQVVQVQRFGPPSHIPTTDEILGRSIGGSRNQEPSPPPPDSMLPSDGIATRGPLDVSRERQEKGKVKIREAAEVALRNLVKEYPSAKLVNIRVFWRNPRLGEYRNKGSRKNVDINEIRRPDNIVAPYGKDWIISFQPIEARWDDPKTWQSFPFERDGPEPKDDWTIDAPPADGLFLEVDDMGQLGMNDLEKLITAGSKSAVQDMMRQLGLVVPQGQVQPYMLPPAPPAPPQPVRDLHAEERERDREKEFRETIKALQQGNQTLLERINVAERNASERIQEAEKARMDALHKAETEALKSAFQSAMDQNRASLDASRAAMEVLNTKLASIEAKTNQPSPPPPPSIPQTDIATALIQIAPHVKDIFTTSRNADAEAAKVREQTLASERQHEADERTREREREREEREKDRERRRADEDRSRDDMRERREAFDRENQRMREEAQRTLDLYRTLGEQSANNARMIGEMFGKQNDPSGTMSVIKMATDSMTQQMQLFAAMVKNGILSGGGPQQPTFDWGRLADQGLNMLGNLGTAYAESKARATAMAARAAQAVASPVASPTMAGWAPQQTKPIAVPRREQAAPVEVPARQRTSQPPTPQVPLQAQQVTPQDATAEDNPLTPFVHGVNQAVAKLEPPDKVADKIAAIVHIAQSFGELEKNRTLKDLMENPDKFLKRAYPEEDPAYLHAIAEQLIEMFPPEGDENDNEENEEDAQQTQPVALETPSPAVQPQPPQAATPSPAAQPQSTPSSSRPQVVLVDEPSGPLSTPLQPNTVATAVVQPPVRRGPGRPRRNMPTISVVAPLPREQTPEPVPEPPTRTPTTGDNAG